MLSFSAKTAGTRDEIQYSAGLEYRVPLHEDLLAIQIQASAAGIYLVLF